MMFWKEFQVEKDPIVELRLSFWSRTCFPSTIFLQSKLLFERKKQIVKCVTIVKCQNKNVWKLSIADKFPLLLLLHFVSLQSPDQLKLRQLHKDYKDYPLVGNPEVGNPDIYPQFHTFKPPSIPIVYSIWTGIFKTEIKHGFWDFSPKRDNEIEFSQLFWASATKTSG